MLFKTVAVAAFVTLALANPLPAGEADACASVHCAEGTACTVVHGQGYCAPTDLTCGSKTCLSGYECCNHNCGARLFPMKRLTPSYSGVVLTLLFTDQAGAPPWETVRDLSDQIQSVG